MAKYVFTYNATYENYTSQEVRREVIKFLNHYRATNLQQCLDTTFVFDSVENLNYWETKIQRDLKSEDCVLENGFYLFNKVFYTRAGGYEITRVCNPELQNFVDEVLAEG
jgi:hypothetical protein